MDRRPDFPTFTQAFFVCVALIVIQVIVTVIYMGFGGKFNAGNPAAVGIVSTISALILFSFLLPYKGLSVAALFHSGPSSVHSVLVLLTLPIVLVAFGTGVMVLNILSVLLYLLPMSQGQVEMFSELSGGGWVTVVIFVLMAPLIEETLFRGIFLRAFLRQYKPRTAIFLASLLFAVCHLNVYQFVTAMIIGTLFGWLYVRTHSLVPCYVGHAAYNGTCLIVGGLARYLGGDGAAANTYVLPVSLQLLGLASLVGGGMMLAKLLLPARSGYEAAE